MTFTEPAPTTTHSIQDLRRRFAAAVAAPSRPPAVLPITAGNRLLAPVTPLPEALAEPYSVYTGDGTMVFTLAFDFDAKLEDAGQVEHEAGALSRLLKAGSIQHVETISGPAGGRHVLARFPEGVHRDFARELGQQLRRHIGFVTLDTACLANPASGSIRPPYAPHRTGGMSLPVGDPQIALMALTRCNPAAAVKQLVRDIARDERIRSATTPGSLRPTTSARNDQSAQPYSLAAATASSSESADGSRGLQGVALNIRNRGGSKADLRRWASSAEVPAAIVANLAKHRSPQSYDNYIDTTWEKARSFHRRNPPLYQGRKDLETLQAIRGHLHSHEAAVPAHARRALWHLLVSAEKLERNLVGCAARQLGRAINCSSSAAAEALKYLGDWQVVETLQAGLHQAHRYRLRHPSDWMMPRAGIDLDASAAVTGVHGGPIGLTEMLDAEAWSSEGLGEQVRLTYQHLLRGCVASGDGSVTVGDLSLAGGCSASTIRRRLADLRRVGLATPLGRGSWVARERTREEVRDELGLQNQLRDRERGIRNERQLDKIRSIERRIQWWAERQQERDLVREAERLTRYAAQAEEPLYIPEEFFDPDDVNVIRNPGHPDRVDPTISTAGAAGAEDHRSGAMS